MPDFPTPKTCSNHDPSTVIQNNKFIYPRQIYTIQAYNK
jgi:hypothetical protein